MKNIEKILFAVALLSMLHIPLASLQAQEGNTYNESVVVKGSYKPVIDESRKLTFPAVVTDTLGRMEHSFQYSISPVRLKALYEPSRIKAARIIGEPATRLYNNYFRIGFGNYWSPLADLYWSSTRDQKKTYGIRINHRSSWGSISSDNPAENYGKNHFGRTGVVLFGKYIIGDLLQLSSDLGYEHDHNLYYGFTDSILTARSGGLTRDDISINDYRIGYNLASWNIGLRNMQLDANKLGYSANLHLSDLWATYGQNQFALNLSGDIHYGFNINNQYKGVAFLHAEWESYSHSVKPNFTADLPMGYNGVAVWDTVRGWGNIIKVNPYADFMLGGLQFHAGVLGAWDAFTDHDSSKILIFPDVTISKKFFNEAIVVSLGATGNVDANNWNTLRLINPYIAPGAEQRATSHYDFAAHMRWSLSKKLEANFDVSYSLLKNDLTFCIDSNFIYSNVYKPHYFDNNRLTVGGDIAFVNDEMLTLRAGGHYYNYSLPDDDTLLLYRPDWDALLAADLNYHDKWFFHLEGRLMGNVNADGGEQLPLRYGINTEVEYRHNRALSFFLKMDNLAFQRYYYWANYPSQRGLFIVGLTYTIPHK